MKSAFIVIDGTDGSGKATQSRLLVERLKNEGFEVATFSFPQYGEKSAGPTEEYLAGKYGTAAEVGSYRGSIFYAIDRYDASFKIRAALAEGRVVISDRYVGSNLGHQGGKIHDSEERLKFFKWNDDLEHNLFGIPRPDINIVLHVRPEISQRLADSGAKKGVNHDIHESNFQHLKDAETAYLEITQIFKNFKLIECVEDDQYLPPEKIHEKIWQLVKPLLISQ